MGGLLALTLGKQTGKQIGIYSHESRKFRLNHHGTNALLSTIIGAFYVRFDPPTTAPSGTLEKCTICGDDDDAK